MTGGAASRPTGGRRGRAEATTVAALAVLPFLVVPMGASARTMQQKLDAACAPDIRRLCPQAAADPDAVKACLLTRRAEASPECLALIDASE